MNILVQAQKYADEPATRCNSFIAAFILFYFTCAAGLITMSSIKEFYASLVSHHIYTLAFSFGWTSCRIGKSQHIGLVLIVGLFWRNNSPYVFWTDGAEVSRGISAPFCTRAEVSGNQRITCSTCRTATCVRSSAGSEGQLSVVGLSPVPFSWVYFCIRSGTSILPWFLYANWTLYYLCCRGFIL